MDYFETNSECRLELRRVIHEVIERTVLGEVSALDEEDLREVRREVSREWDRRGWGERKGYRYVCFLCEMRLLLGLPDPLRALRGKLGAPKVNAGKVMPGLDGWLRDRAGGKVSALPDQAVELGELFENKK